jgi:hypothetical protein
VMKIIDGDRIIVLDWVYTSWHLVFQRCEWYLLIHDEGDTTVYGLGFDPFDLSAHHHTQWHWPTNEMLHNATNALCGPNARWEIVRSAYKGFA